MTISKTKICVDLILCLTLAHLLQGQEKNEQGSKSCRQFVEAFYGWYIPLWSHSLGEGPTADERAVQVRPQAFSTGLILQLSEDNEAQDAADGDLVGLDGDPFTGSQDSDERFILRRVSTKGNRCWAEMHGVWYGKEDATPDVTPELLLKNGRWVFVNFHYQDPARPGWSGSLLKELKLNREARTCAREEPFTPQKPDALSSQNFEVLGITLGTSETADLKRILGPGTARETPERQGVVTCYCSLGNDGTVLEFDSWAGSIVQFRFYQGSPQEASRCRKSKLVSRSLATAEGVRLGMSRTEILTLLGEPTEKHEDHLFYELDYDRPPTPQELKQLWDASAAAPASVNVYGEIDFRFRGGEVVRVNVRRAKEIAE